MALGEKRQDAMPTTGAPAAAPITDLGPYRIHERLGSGGMGEVYKAYDDRLERWVAIKRIRPDKEEAAEHRSRLRREARAAARLNHPSIVHVYDIFEDRDSDCIVMELVEGVGLDKLLQHGPMDPYRVAEIGRQIASGLAEAHEKGILHRDLKTENVIIMPNDQPKILDFGLAKPMIQGDLDSTLTGKGQVVGTSRTMSPEYVSGDEVDHRSDLFSLGVLLYESVTAKSPFKAHNTLATLKRVILHRQPPALDLNPAVPEAFSNLIDRLLEKEPAERQQSANEVAEALAVLTGSSSIGFDRPGSTGSFAVLPRQAPANRWWTPAMVAVAVAVGLLTAWLIARSTEQALPISAEVAESSTVVLGEFINRTEEEILDETLDYALRVGLEQSETVNILSRNQIESSLQRMALDIDTPIDRDVALEIAQREGALCAIFGQIAKVGEAYAINAEIVEPESGSTIFATSETAEDQTNVIGRLNDIVAALRAHLGESTALVQENRPKLEKVTTANLEALKVYSLGVDRFNRSDYKAAVPLFEHAIGVDPGFAMAYAKLGTTHQYSGSVARALENFQLALQATDRLTLEEELYIRGWIALWTETPEDMLQAWRKMRDLTPERIEGHSNYAMTSWTHFRRAETALEASNEAIVRMKGDPSRLYYNKASLELSLEKYTEALSSFRQANLASSLLGATRAYLAQGLLDSAEQSLQEAMERKPPTRPSQSDIDQHQTLLLISSGRLQEALQLTEAATQRASEAGYIRGEHNHRAATLALLAHLGNPSFLNVFRTSLDRATELLDRDRFELEFSPITLLALLGKLAVRAGYPEEAAEIHRRIEPLSVDSGFPLWSLYSNMLNGELAAASGRIEEARGLFVSCLESMDSFQVHESLAHMEQAAGNIEASVIEYRWLTENAGQAFTECEDPCFDTVPNALAWVDAYAQLAILLGDQGDHTASQAAGEMFLALWKEAPDSQKPLPQLRAILVPSPAHHAESAPELATRPQTANP